MNILNIPAEVFVSNILPRINYVPPEFTKHPHTRRLWFLYGNWEKIEDENELERVCADGDYLSVFYCRTRLSWSRGYFNACKSGNKHLINLLRSKGAMNAVEGLMGACEGSHADVILSFRTSLVLTSVPTNTVVRSVCQTGNKEALAALYGVLGIQTPSKENLKCEILGYCASDDLGLLKDAIHRHELVVPASLSRATTTDMVIESFRANNPRILNYILQVYWDGDIGTLPLQYLTACAVAASEGGHVAMFDILHPYLESAYRNMAPTVVPAGREEKPPYPNLSTILSAAMLSSTIEIVDKLVMMITAKGHSVSAYLSSEHLGECKESVIKYFLERHIPIGDDFLMGASRAGNIEYVKKCVAVLDRTDNKNERMLQNCLSQAALLGRYDVVKYYLGERVQITSFVEYAICSTSCSLVEQILDAEKMYNPHGYPELLNRFLTRSCAFLSHSITDLTLDIGATYCSHCKCTSSTHLRSSDYVS